MNDIPASASPEALLADARAAASRGDFAGGAELLRGLLEATPDHAEACFGLAVMSQQLGRAEEAEHWYARVVELRPDDAVANYNLGVVQQGLGRQAEAAAAYGRAIELAPNLYQAYFNLGNIHAGERPEEALICYRRALAVQPRMIEALLGIGRVHQRLGQTDPAGQAFRQALAIQPDYPPALYAIGVLCQDMGALAHAAAWYRRLLQARPDHADACFNLAKACQDQGEFEEAVARYRQAIALRRGENRPSAGVAGLDEACYNLGFILKKQGRKQEWLDNFRDFETASKGSMLLALDGVSAARNLGDGEREAHYWRQLMAHVYGENEIPQLRIVLSLALFFDVSPSDLLSLYRQFDALTTARAARWPALELPVRTPASRIRIGYLSPDFYRHVMGLMMSEVLPRHDADRFEIYCYSLNDKADEVTEVIRRHCVKYQSVRGMAPRQAAELIARDGLDILVDLATHSIGTEPEILAHKPARIQITHVGSAGAVGLSSIDFKLTDTYAEADGNQQYLIETLLPMAGCVYPYHPMCPAETHGYRRDRMGIDDDSILIGAFINLLKMSPRCLRVWRRVLSRLPKARLVFSPLKETDRDGYIRVAGAAGIEPERLLFIPSGSGDGERLSRYELIDFVLDPFPFGGVNGVLEPLTMGVPVVALVGQRHGERTAYSILANLGVEATVAHGEDEYVDIAARLAEDRPFRENVQAAIRHGLRDSPLVDRDAHVRNLEAAYLRAMEIKGVS